MVIKKYTKKHKIEEQELHKNISRVLKEYNGIEFNIPLTDIYWLWYYRHQTLIRIRLKFDKLKKQQINRAIWIKYRRPKTSNYMKSVKMTRN